MFIRPFHFVLVGTAVCLAGAAAETLNYLHLFHGFALGVALSWAGLFIICIAQGFMIRSQSRLIAQLSNLAEPAHPEASKGRG